MIPEVQIILAIAVGLALVLSTVALLLFIDEKEETQQSLNKQQNIIYREPTRPNKKCAVENCRIRAPHSHVIDLCKRIKGE